MQDKPKRKLTRSEQASARRLRVLIQDIWSEPKRCPHTRVRNRIIPAFMDDHGDMVDTLVIKTCANRRCNRLLGYV